MKESTKDALRMARLVLACALTWTLVVLLLHNLFTHKPALPDITVTCPDGTVHHITHFGRTVVRCDQEVRT